MTGTPAGRRTTRGTSGCRKQGPRKSRGRTELGMGMLWLRVGHAATKFGPKARKTVTQGLEVRRPRHQGLSPTRSRASARAIGEDESPLAEGPLPGSGFQSAAATPPARSHGRAKPPPALLDRNGELYFHVERILQERHLHGKRDLPVK
ncbi:hypothetical protein ON010_g5321 [Phytophthora cinnamomi]|nr:hypothetical protein ON010_g5321 [Phytophthora cinnamomi]